MYCRNCQCYYTWGSKYGYFKATVMSIQFIICAWGEEYIYQTNLY